MTLTQLTFCGIISDSTTNGMGNIPHEPKYKMDEALTIGTHPNACVGYPSDCKYVKMANTIRLNPVPTEDIVNNT